MDLKSFKKSSEKKENRQESSAKQGNVNEEDVTKMFEKYKDKSESELMAELMKEASRGKRDGTFDAGKIRSFQESVAPYLTDEQREKMKNLISMLES